MTGKGELLMPLKFAPTPFSGQDWQRRFELFDSISLWALVMSIVVVILYALLIVFQYQVQFLWLGLCTLSAVTACVAARILARRGYLELGVYLVIGVLLLVMSVSSLILEGTVLIVATWYVAVIVLTGLMMGPGASLGVAALSALLSLTVLLLSRLEVVTPLDMGEGWRIALVSLLNALTFFFVAHLGRLSTQDLRRALRDATYDLVKANQELQEANRLKNRFLARVSHELRTPLNAIIGYTDMNLAGYYGDLNDAQRDALERVQRNGRQLLHLINDVLDLSRIDALGVELQSGDFSPRELVQSVVGTVEPRVQRKGLELTYEVDPSLPTTLFGDQVRLNQVLLNLVDNAIKFTDQGSIHVAVGNGGRSGDADTWTLQVRDTGRGISERELPYVFEEFRQGASVYGKQADGVGLGLAIARRLVSAMGGEIRVQSRLGAGSTFTVVLPTAPVVPREEERV
jgi:signal transduction histidine kinase